MSRYISLTVGAAALALAPLAPVFAPPALAQEPQPIYSNMDRIHPVYAANGMVASQEAMATEVGVDILEAGGNAVDAAVAVGFALAVTHPAAGNLGGGGFMLVHDAESGTTEAIDYREKAPAAATRDMFLDAEGNADPNISRFTPLAIGVPGTPAGMALALERYGTMSLAEVMAPAIRLAEGGFEVSVELSESLKASQARLTQWPATAKVFYKPDGSAYEPGETLKQPDLAASLRAIAANGPAAFYEGAIGAMIVDAVEEAGGIITTDDLARYDAVVRAPVAGTYRGYDILSMPPPSSGGTHIVQILNILEGYDIGVMGAGSAETIHVMAEAMKRAYADRSEYLGDSDFVEVPVAELTSKAYAEARRSEIDPERATPSDTIAPAESLLPYESPQTTHFSVIDAEGNAVANTYTLNFGYGVGLVAEGTGILLNNEMDDFSAKPGVPNAYGLVGGDANAVEPGKRPLSSMSPTLVLKDGEVFLATGSPGGSLIITATLQIIMNVVDHGMNIAEASVFPRVHHQWLPDELRVEEGLSPDTLRLLEEWSHSIAVKAAMGATQSIMRRDDGALFGASDTRRPTALTAGY